MTETAEAFCSLRYTHKKNVRLVSPQARLRFTQRSIGSVSLMLLWGQYPHTMHDSVLCHRWPRRVSVVWRRRKITRKNGILQMCQGCPGAANCYRWRWGCEGWESGGVKDSSLIPACIYFPMKSKKQEIGTCLFTSMGCCCFIESKTKPQMEKMLYSLNYSREITCMQKGPFHPKTQTRLAWLCWAVLRGGKSYPGLLVIEGSRTKSPDRWLPARLCVCACGCCTFRVVTCMHIKLWNMSFCSAWGFHGRWWYVEENDCFQTPAGVRERRVRGGGGGGEERRTWLALYQKKTSGNGYLELARCLDERFRILSICRGLKKNMGDQETKRKRTFRPYNRLQILCCRWLHSHFFDFDTIVLRFCFFLLFHTKARFYF